MQSLNERYGFDRKVQLEYLAADRIAIVKFVRRRIVVADTERFIDIANQIRQTDPDMKISLLCSDNICSKAVRKLSEAGIDVLTGEPENDM
ncbi:MAG: hypothetical protein J6Y82_10040 [Bacteroidales bacterium]|nr:hypothetical protein [Bacteroidales bacterium]